MILRQPLFYKPSIRIPSRSSPSAPQVTCIRGRRTIGLPCLGCLQGRKALASSPLGLSFHRVKEERGGCTRAPLPPHPRPRSAPPRRRSSALPASSRRGPGAARMCLAPPPRPWIPLPLRWRCSRSRLQAPRRLRSPWPGRAGCSGRCSEAAAATVAAAGAPALPACPSTRLPAPSRRASRAAAACCCCSGPPRPPPLRLGASIPGLCLPGGWRGLPPRPPPPPPRPLPLTRLCAPRCCRSRWRRPRARRGDTARYVGAVRDRARDPSPAARTCLRAPLWAPRVRARGAAARAAPPRHPRPRPPTPPIGSGNKGRSPRPGFSPCFVLLLSVWSVGQCKCGWG